MSISVVTVVLNAADSLALTIESVRHQDYMHFEFIVIDGGSYDGTASVIERYRDSIDRVEHIEDAGIYYAMNLATDYCKNDYVLFLNAGDTLYGQSTLSRLMACKQPDVDVFFGNHVYVSGRREYYKSATDYDLTARLLLRGEIDHGWLSRLPGHQATFVRCDLLRSLRFNTDIQICADHDLLIRAYHTGARFQYIDETVSHYVGGGFSAQRPNRLMLEWCAVYREYSLEPAAVDRFFLENASPFDSQNAMTGLRVSGDYPREGPQPERGIPDSIHWCRPDGTRLRVPASGAAKSLRLEGFSAVDSQLLTFFQNDEELGWIRVDSGWFRKTVLFAWKVPPQSQVEIVASRIGEVSELDKRVVGFALSSFAFETTIVAERIFARGERIVFGAKNVAVTKRILGDGWATQENDFIWTIGERADLAFRVAADVTSIRFQLSGNPFIEDHNERGVDIELNGNFLGRHLLPGDRFDMVSADFPSLLSPTPINIVMKPVLRMRSPGDPRTLGICLSSLEIV